MQIARILLALSGLLSTVGAGSWAEEVASVPTDSATCELCRRPLRRHYFKIPGLSEYYCEDCHRASPRCVFCSRPFPPMPEGGEVCSKCRAAAVINPDEALAVFMRVRDWLHENLDLTWSGPVPFETTGNLAEVVGIERESGFRELGAFVREGQSGGIVLLEGLPRELLIETVAHELAHAWQAEHCPPKQTLLWKEGFAQWVAAKALGGFECKETLRVLEHREDLYGRGYRMIRDLESKRGRQGVLSVVRERR